MNWHLLPLSEIEKTLETTATGLDGNIIAQRQTEYGKNIIQAIKKRSPIQMFLHQFTDFMILILVAAAIISGVLGDLTDTIIILAIILMNAIVGFIQEYRAEKAIEALKKMAASGARVIRNGVTSDIEAAELVPGDVVLLEAGNIIPADVRFFETHQVKVDESALTGESHNVEKISEIIEDGESSLGDRINMGYKGTFFTNGRASAYVTATGMQTELGLIAKMIQTDEVATPLQKRLTAFGKRLSVIILFICALIFGFGWLRNEDLLTMLLTSISLAVAAIPEALPALVTIALAIGAKRLVVQNALIRKLPAVETLGSVTYICTDKTGTLTLNKMTVQEIFESPDLQNNSVFPDQKDLLYAMALNNDVMQEKEGLYLGDSTEVALVQYAADQKLLKADAEKLYPRVAEIPFNSTRKCMTTIHKYEDEFLVITKGAVDILMHALHPNQKEFKSDFNKRVNAMAEKGYRVLGYAIKKIKSLPEKLEAELIENDLYFLGFAGMIDPSRPEAKQAVAECKQAGIIPVMITGDHKLTAKAIASQLGILTLENDKVLSGQELAALSEEEFEAIVEEVKVYARVNPEQKLKIIKALQHKDQFVAMTGDGVNDAPALKNADIGIAMGINGTEVTKEASHMILLDDNFSTIVVAIKHGRRIFDNILKFIKYIMTGNSGEIWAIVLAPFFGLPIPLLAIHILWINLVTDGLPGLALASEPAEPNIMKRPPRKPTKNIFAGGMAIHILWVGLLMGIITISMQAWAIEHDHANWQTMAFTVLCLSQMGHVMAIRSDEKSIFETGVLRNKPMLLALIITIGLQMMIIYTPFFNDIFKTQPLTLTELAITIVVSSIVFWAVELEKRIKKLVRARVI